MKRSAGGSHQEPLSRRRRSQQSVTNNSAVSYHHDHDHLPPFRPALIRALSNPTDSSETNSPMIAPSNHLHQHFLMSPCHSPSSPLHTHFFPGGIHYNQTTGHHHNSTSFIPVQRQPPLSVPNLNPSPTAGTMLIPVSGPAGGSHSSAACRSNSHLANLHIPRRLSHSGRPQSPLYSPIPAPSPTMSPAIPQNGIFFGSTNPAIAVNKTIPVRSMTPTRRASFSDLSSKPSAMTDENPFYHIARGLPVVHRSTLPVHCQNKFRSMNDASLNHNEVPSTSRSRLPHQLREQSSSSHEAHSAARPTGATVPDVNHLHHPSSSRATRRTRSHSLSLAMLYNQTNLSEEDTHNLTMSQGASALQVSFSKTPKSSSSVCPPSESASTTQCPLEQLEDDTSNPFKTVRKAGPYLLGPRLGSSPVKSIVQCLARKQGSRDFYCIKILTISNTKETSDDERQGKMLLHTEYSLLSLLHNQEGVVHHHGLFQDKAFVPKHADSTRSKKLVGSYKQRLCLVLDCLVAHDFSTTTSQYINLQHYVIREKKLCERETIAIFYDIVRIVESLHKKNIVHRDLKLGNMVLNKKTHRITLTNFCLGKHLVSEKDLLKDQRGSPAYISPDVLSGKPYLGKPSDMWALGVVLFTMLFGQFPFYDIVPDELFRKIKAAEFTIPNDGRVSESNCALIRGLLVLDPARRLTASQVLDALSNTLSVWNSMRSQGDALQVVPDIDDIEELDKEETQASISELETKLKESERTMKTEQKTAVAVRKIASHITMPQIRRVEEDARPLTQAEMLNHRHIISQ
ncbi:serine/threonine-protein kinase ppk1-like [Anneissia japonica]|uniref:serine/threonine-protein kinase ppk1-like n=1 Tax=Anneissia japonica TaxID=1529436 RepID=UPI001425AEBF|nr:serine/threonine-protein kinase ppk1-like [Anneissia japonica]